MQEHIVNYPHQVIHQISVSYSSCIIETFLFFFYHHHPVSSQSQPLATTILLSAFMSLVVLDSTCKCDHVVFISLFHWAYCSSASTMWQQMAGYPSFLRMNNILFGTVPLYPFIHRQTLNLQAEVRKYDDFNFVLDPDYLG